LGKELGLALRPDFFGDPSVRCASAFFNADAPDGAADDPVG
jgi:hypothetical protein